MHMFSGAFSVPGVVLAAFGVVLATVFVDPPSFEQALINKINIEVNSIWDFIMILRFSWFRKNISKGILNIIKSLIQEKAKGSRSCLSTETMSPYT